MTSTLWKAARKALAIQDGRQIWHNE